MDNLYEPSHISLYWRVVRDPAQEWLPRDAETQKKIAHVFARSGWPEHAEQIHIYIQRMKPTAKAVFAHILPQNKRGLAEESLISLSYGENHVDMPGV